MPRAPRRPLAIVLAASTVSVSLFLAGCEGDEASRADKRVSQQLRQAYTQDDPIDALKEAAAEDAASGASRARAQSMLADAEVIKANELVRQVEQSENQIKALVWELNQLGQSIHTSARLIEAYRSYDPSVVQKAAEARVSEAQGTEIKLDLRGEQVTFAGLEAVRKNIDNLNDQIAKQKGEVARLNEQRNSLVKQSQDAAQQAESLTGKQGVEAYAKASNLRKEASLLASQIDIANAALARLNADLAVQQGQQEILARLVQEYQQEVAATDKGFKSVAAQAEAQQRLIQEIYGTAGGAPATSSASGSATVQARAAELAALVEKTESLRGEAIENLESAVQHYSAAQQSAEDQRRKIDEKLATADPNAPERQAWEDMKKLVNPSAYQLQKATALEALGNLYAADAAALAARVQLQNNLTKSLQSAGLNLPASLVVKDGPARLKTLNEKMNETYAEAADLQQTVFDAPLATESQKEAARIAKILTLYAWGEALEATGSSAEAKKHRAEAMEMVKGAVADDVTLPALPPEIAPTPKVASAPTTSPAARPAPAPTAPQPGSDGAETPVPQ